MRHFITCSNSIAAFSLQLLAHDLISLLKVPKTCNNYNHCVNIRPNHTPQKKYGTHEA
jgi:hypothetical protein